MMGEMAVVEEEEEKEDSEEVLEEEEVLEDEGVPTAGRATEEGVPRPTTPTCS